jgi:hypothetical protein
MNDFETLRRQHLTHALALAPGLIERLDWSADQIAAERDQKLRALATDERLRATSMVLANVAASHPTHATAALSHTFSGPHLVSLRFPVTLPIGAIVDGLN